MSVEIDTNITCPDGSKICRTCGHDLPLSEFSLKYGKHSPKRKPDCKTCEYNNRKKRENATKIVVCRVCGKSGRCKLVTSPSGKIPLATVCVNCLPIVSIGSERLQVALNFAKMAEQFPFILKAEMHSKNYKVEPETPLLDAIRDYT